MDMIPANGAMEGRRAGELHIRAEIVLARAAVVALVAGNAGLDGDAVAGREMLDVGPRGEDDASAFVAEDVVGGDDAGAYLAEFPEMKIGTEEEFSVGSWVRLEGRRCG